MSDDSPFSPKPMDEKEKIESTDIENNEKDVDIETEDSLKNIPIPGSVKDLKIYCEYKRDLHYICSKYYEKWNFRFQIPSIFITSVSGIISFFATSSVFENNVQFLSLLVGVCASSSAVVQAVSNIFDFGGKASSHEYAVMSYDQILTKIRFMILKGNADSQSNIELIERLIFELKQRVKYITPSWAEQRLNSIKHKTKTHMLDLKKKDLLYEKQYKEMKELESLKLTLFQKNIKEITTIEDLKRIKVI